MASNEQAMSMTEYDMKHYPPTDSDIRNVKRVEDSLHLYFNQHEFREDYISLTRDDIIAFAKHFDITEKEINEI